MRLKLLKILSEEVSEQYWGLAWQDNLSDEEKKISDIIDSKKISRQYLSSDIINIDSNNSFLIKPSEKRGSPFDQIRGSKKHKGIDYKVGVGTNIVLLKPGVVTEASMTSDPGGYGAAIYIKHDDGVYTRYGHLSKINVNVGDRVVVGDVIAKTGGAKGAYGAGNSEGPHLHFEYRPSNTPQDPASGDRDNTVFRFANDSDLNDIIITPTPKDKTEDDESDPVVDTNFKIDGDVSGSSTYPYKNTPLQSNKYFILHHTASRGTPNSIVGILNSNNLGVQWIIDRESKIFRGLPENAQGDHFKSGKLSKLVPQDIHENNSQGVEIIAKNDDDVLPLQCFSALKIVKHLGYSLSDIYTHGEINPGHKAKTEGRKCKTFFEDNWNKSFEDISIDLKK